MIGLYHSIVGLPETGKTTFLAALWHLMCAGEIAPALSVGRLEGNRRHLDKIVEIWRRGEIMTRTKLLDEATFSIHAHDTSANRPIVLGFSDLSGEGFEQQFATRRCAQAYLEHSRGPGGLLLFVNADHGLDGISLMDMAGLLADGERATAPIVQGDASEAQPAEPIKEWVPSLVPRQAQLVDLLQILQHHPFDQRQRAIAVIVSAWDVVTDNTLAPHDWLKREMPLLHQFLLNNRASFVHQTFGVSAQGGNLSDDDVKARLLQLEPSRRIRCVAQGVEDHDLSRPIVWLNAQC